MVGNGRKCRKLCIHGPINSHDYSQKSAVNIPTRLVRRATSISWEFSRDAVATIMHARNTFPLPHLFEVLCPPHTLHPHLTSVDRLAASSIA